jgi:transcriptional regulator
MLFMIGAHAVDATMVPGCMWVSLYHPGMHIPPAFAWTDPDSLAAFCRAHPFATVVHAGADGCAAQHIPLLVDVDAGRLVLHGHVAAANPLAEARDATAIFHGPHAFVSAAWYGEPGTVPTWNYLAVHARGPVEPIDDPAAARSLSRRLGATDPEHGAWTAGLSPEVEDRLLAAVRWFRIPVTTIEGKAKLSQNHPAARRQRVIDRLGTNADSQDKAVSAAMARVMDGRTPWPAG